MTNLYKQAILWKLEAIEESILSAQSVIDKWVSIRDELHGIMESVEGTAEAVDEVEEKEPPVAGRKVSNIVYAIKPDVEPPVEKEEAPVVKEVKLGQCPRCMQYPVDFTNVDGGLQCSSCWGMVWYDSTTKGVALRDEEVTVEKEGAEAGEVLSVVWYERASAGGALREKNGEASHV